MKSTFDKNAEKFVNLMVEKIESLSMNWQKPWFSKVNSKQNFLPQNLTGRTYSGGNAFLLYFLCEKYNYQTPVFLTFNQARNEGINVLKGAVAFPVYYTLFCAYHRQTNEKISYDEYNKLSEEEQKEYRLAAYTKYFQVFNLDQTNFAEKYPNKMCIRDRFRVIFNCINFKNYKGFFKKGSVKILINLKSASNLNGNLNCSKELEHYAS